jgi:uncharacterized membrane protein
MDATTTQGGTQPVPETDADIELGTPPEPSTPAVDPQGAEHASRAWVGPTIAGVVVMLAYVQLVWRNWADMSVNGYDTGIMSQVVQSYAHFQLPHSAIKGFPNIFADHFSPVMALFAPLWWVWPDPRVLLLAQAVLLGIGAAGIYVVGRRMVGTPLAIAAVALFATWPGTQAGGGFDIHEVAFYVPLTVWAIERGFAGKWRTAWILAACLLLVREDGGLILASFAMWAFIRGRRKDALIAFGGGIIATVLVSALLKHLDAKIGFPGYFPLQNLGPTPLAAVVHIVSHPGETLHLLVNPAVKVHTIKETLRPFLALPLLSSLVVMFIPQLLLRLLGGRQVLWTLGFHYSLPIAGILAIAYLDGIVRVKGWLTRGKNAARDLLRWQVLEVVLILAAVVMMSLNFSSSVLLLGSRSNMADAWVPTCKLAIAKVPAGTLVAASNSTSAYLVAKHDVRLWRGGARPGEYVLIGPPGETGHLNHKYAFAVKRIAAVAEPVLLTHGCKLYHYTSKVPLKDLISINDLQPDPTGKTNK